MTWEEIDTACRGYEVREAKRKELDRFNASILINANRRRGSKAVRPQDIMSLITDAKARRVELMTKEEYEKAKEMFSKVKWQ